jgi:hypothetical protein
MDKSITPENMTDEVKKKYLFNWSWWLFYFYMDETRARIWFFRQMRSLDNTDDTKANVLDVYENYLNAISKPSNSKDELHARFTILLAHSFIQSINVYRACSTSLPLDEMIPDDLLGPFIYRGIRVSKFNKDQSQYPTNFQSFSMATSGVNSVFDHYETSHQRGNEFTAVIVLGDAKTLIKTVAQPIAFYGMHAKQAYIESEKEIIFPPFCDFQLVDLDISHFTNIYDRELIISQLWNLNYFTKYPQLKKNFKLKLLWIEEVDCLPFFEKLSSSVHPTKKHELEKAKNRVTLFQHRLDFNRMKSIYTRTEQFSIQFSDMLIHPCIRLFASHINDLNSTDVITDEKVEKIISEMVDQNFFWDSVLENKPKSNLDPEYVKRKINKMNEDEENKKELCETFEKNFNKLSTTIALHYFFDTVQNIDENHDTKKIDLSLKQFYYQNTKDTILDNKKQWENKAYQILYIKLIYLEYYYSVNELEDLINSCKFCKKWLEEEFESYVKGKMYEIPGCEDVTANTESDVGQFVCAFPNHTYSKDLFFPCQRPIEGDKNEYGTFCQLQK